MTDKDASLDQATRALAHVIRAENDALAATDFAAAARLVPAKIAAVEAMRACLPGARADIRVATMLKEAAAENSDRLALAISVQQRILEMVTRAAKASAPGAVSYSRRGRMRSEEGAMALTLRA